MRILRAQKANIDQIEAIYEHIHDAEDQGLATIGWIRNVYPTRKTAEDALVRNDLFVMEDDGRVVAAAIINQIQVEAYQRASWKHDAKDQEVMVIHCLTVDAWEGKRGYGKAFVAFYEEYAKQNGCYELRIDTNARNIRARKLYQKLGYEEVGIVDCVFQGIPDVKLVCLEKYLG